MADLSKVSKGSPRTNIAAKFQNGPLDTLPPIGVFWDIENCQVPKGKSVTALVRSIREKFFHGHREAEFLCVCDINKENKDVIHELNLAQVTVVHINATSKNAADDKLKQCMRRFVDTHGMPSTILLISGDVNFATHLSDFRHRDNIYIKLVHKTDTPEPLLVCAHELYSFNALIMNLPPRTTVKGSGFCNRCELVVSDLPDKRDPKQIQSRLRQLSDNCGGKVLNVSGSTAKLRFPNAEAAQRAKKRMDREDVFGRKISVSYFHPSTSGEEFPDTPLKPYHSGQKKYKNTRRQCASSSSSCNSSPVSQGGECGKSVIPIQHFDFPPPPDLSSDDCPKRKAKQKVHHLSRRAEEERDHKLHWGQRSKDPSPVSQQVKDLDMGNKPLSQKNVGRVSPFVMVDGTTKSNYQFTSISRSEPPLHYIRTSVNSPADNYNGPLSTSPYHFNSFSSSSSMFFSPLQPGTEYQNQVGWNSPTAPVLSDIPHPIGRASPIVPACPSPVEMLVTNLDQSFEANEMKKILLSVFREHVMVLHISMLLQPDGSLKAVVKVPSLQDAQYAISQLHRRKIGYKRLLISYASADRAPPLHVLRSEAVALLMDIPSKKLPLFKFRELYEKRYHRSISVSELYKMREAINVIDSNSGRLVCLNADFRYTPSPTDSEGSQEVQQILEKPYCEHHFEIADSQGWAEQISVYPLPNVHISLKTLAPRVHTLLDTHQGSLPLNSFCSCYKAEFGPLPAVENLENKYRSPRESANIIPDLYTDDAQNERQVEGDAIPRLQKGVPLEHLIACIPGVQITKSVLAIKKIQWLENKPDQEIRSISPALAGQLTLFCRETVDLLKSQTRCSIPFNKFIPAYHHHFGRQCRVSDYGFIKLIDLLESVPHSVQILGQGQNRILTLTHRAQVKRFAADLLRILKSRASKQVTLSELPTIYEQCINKPFDICDYGVCEVTDMLAEISENTIVIISSAEETVIGIPKREQTPEEIERTKHFALEVLELLRHTPNCSMPFSKFIPAYHHHFNKQCRVADYGFSKLIELFEVIPDILEVTGIGEDKVLHLVEQEKLKILAERLVSIIRSSPQQSLPLSSLLSMYSRQHGCALRCEDFGSSDMPELISKLRNSLKMQTVDEKPVVTVVDQGFTHTAALRVKRLLMENVDGKEDINELQRKYKERFDSQINVLSLQNDLEDVQMQDNFIKLSPLLMLCRDILILLHEHDGQIPLQNFEILFLQRFNAPCLPAQYGFPSMAAMLQSQPDYFLIKGRRSKRVVTINKETAGSPLPKNITSRNVNDFEIKPVQSEENKSEFLTNTSTADNILTEELLQMRNSPVDLLSEPIPSGVPSPEIHPEKQCLPDKDLMGFESPLPSAQDVITGTVEKERQQLKTPPLCQTSVVYPNAAIISQSPPSSIEADVLRALLTNSTSHSQSFSAPPSYTHFAVPLTHFQALSAPSCLSPTYQAVFQSPPSMTYFISNGSLTQSFGTTPPTTVSSLPIIAQSPGISFHDSHSSPGSSLPLGATSSPIVPILPGGLNLSSASGYISIQNPLSLQTESIHRNLQRINESNIFASGNMRADSVSYEDLTLMGNRSLDCESFPSTQSTPTRGSTRGRPRSRIAAQFSNPLDLKD